MYNAGMDNEYLSFLYINYLFELKVTNCLYKYFASSSIRYYLFFEYYTDSSVIIDLYNVIR